MGGVEELENRGVLRRHVEEHAVCFSVAEALALAIRFAETGASCPVVLCAGGVEEVGCGGLGVADDAAVCGRGGGSGWCGATTCY